MRIGQIATLNSLRTKATPVVLRQMRANGITAGGPGSGPRPGYHRDTSGYWTKDELRPGLANLNDKELLVHHALLEKAGAPNEHTAEEIRQRQDDHVLHLTDAQTAQLFKALKGKGMKLGDDPNYIKALDTHVNYYHLPSGPGYEAPSVPSSFAADISAGGPGSGRHKYNTTVADQHPFHQTLIDHGFKHNYSIKNSHYYLGDQSKRADAKTDSGKPTQWTAGFSMHVGSNHGKPSWADPSSMAYHGGDNEGLEGYLRSIGYKSNK